MPAQTTSGPLTEHERRMLAIARNAYQQSVNHTRTAIVSLAILGPAMLALMVSLRAGPQSTQGWVMLGVLALACAVVARFIWRHALRTRASGQQPLTAALAGGNKQVTTGHLDSIEAGRHGGLRYRIGGQTLDLIPLAAAYDIVDLEGSKPIHDLSHAYAGEITLDWIAQPGGPGLLLGTAPAGGPNAIESAVDDTPEDRRRAQWRARGLLILLALVLPCSIYLGSRDSFTVNVLVYLIAGGAIAGLAYLNMRRQRLHNRALHTYSGRVTESFFVWVRSGSDSSRETRQHWYRVGGRLISPESVATRRIGLGDWVRIESLVPTDPNAAEELVSVSPVEPPAGSVGAAEATGRASATRP